MKQPEVLRLADALDDEFTQGRISNHTGRKAATELRRLHEVNQDLLKALHEALEEKQEPVAWRYALDASVEGPRWIYIDKDPHQLIKGPSLGHALIESLYTSPPKQWVGLTDEEVSYCRYAATFCDELDTAYMAELIEKDLKEKNHG